jgi:hypothetical protein
MRAFALCFATLVTSVVVLGQEPPTIVDPTAYEVYAAVLKRSDLPPMMKQAKPLVLELETTVMGLCGVDESRLSEPWRSVAESFRDENRCSGSLVDYRRECAGRTLDASRIADPRIVTRTRAEIAGLFERGRPWDWAPFHKAFPGSGGYLTMSAVGLDASRTHALVSVYFGCDTLCGEGGPYFLERDATGWQLVRPHGVELCRVFSRRQWVDRSRHT